MTDNVVHIAGAGADNRSLSPIQALEWAIKDIQSGERACNRLLIITLDDTNGQYHSGYYAANIKQSEILALLHFHATAAAFRMANNG